MAIRKDQRTGVEQTAPRTNYGKLLRKTRRKKGMSTRQLAASISVDHSYLSRIESNKVAPPSWTNMAAIAKVLQSDDLREMGEYALFKNLLICIYNADTDCREMPEHLKSEIGVVDVNDLQSRFEFLMPKLLAAMMRRLKPGDWKTKRQTKPGRALRRARAQVNREP